MRARAFSRLKGANANTAITFMTLLRHYATLALTHTLICEIGSLTQSS